MQSIKLLSDSIKAFNNYCVVGIDVNTNKLKAYTTESLMLVTALNSKIGYDKAAMIAKKAYKEGKSLKEAAIELNLVTSELFDKWVRPEDMLAPHWDF